MLHAITYDGNDPKNLIVNSVSSSPLSTHQYDYDGICLQSSLTDLFKRWGVMRKDTVYLLLDKDTSVLQKADFETVSSWTN